MDCCSPVYVTVDADGVCVSIRKENKCPQVYTLCTLVGYMLEYLCMVLSWVVVVLLLLARDCH